LDDDFNVPKKHLESPISKPYNSSLKVMVTVPTGFSFGEPLRIRNDANGSVLYFDPNPNDTSKPIVAEVERVTGNLNLSVHVEKDTLQDSDQDGLSNYLESLYGTDPNDDDSDDDFLPDWWELVDWRGLKEDKIKYDQAFWSDVRTSQAWLTKDPNRMSLPTDHNDSVLYSHDPDLQREEYLRLNPKNKRDGDPDDDFDGKPDKGGLATTPWDDPDFDGLSNLDEYLSGTNPLDPDTFGTGKVDQYSPIDLNSTIVTDANVTEVSFLFKKADSETNGTSKIPLNWIDLNGSAVPGTIFPRPNAQGLFPMVGGQTYTLEVTSVTPGFVFDSWSFNGNQYSTRKVEYQPNGSADEVYVRFRLDDNDTDGDGLTNFQELYPENGIPVTNPDMNDTDGDSISDKIEVDYGLKPDDNVTELLLLGLVRANPAVFGISAPQATSPSSGSGIPSGGSNAPSGGTNAPSGGTNTPSGGTNAPSVNPFDGNYTAGFQRGWDDAWKELNATTYRDGVDQGLAAGRNEVLNGTVRIDLYRFIAADKGSLLSTVTAADKGWFYTPAHGWSWLSPDAGRAGFVYNAEVNSWVLLNPSVGSGVTGGSFGQFIGLDRSGNPTYGNYPFSSHLQSTPPNPNANPSGAGGSSGSSSPSTQDTGFGDL